MWIWIFVGFYAGYIFGVIMSALMIAAHDEDELYK
jgi:hypothetical protein